MDHVVQTLMNEAAKSATPDESRWTMFGVLTPVDTILVTFILFTISGWIFPPSFPKPARSRPPRVFKTFTPRTLLPYTGVDGTPIYLAVKGQVFDVTHRPQFYGPGSSYANFAGRDASRGLATNSFDEDVLTQDLDGPLDPLEGLTDEQIEALNGWEESFRGKYTVVGKLVSQADYDKMEKK
ncbi:hypothetical protein TD95_002833 [Thielaviopsis punctulata]|uniref:Cytochrome b5 heme-binding domain-containing protein n=1 Tax=Thielaviopsis punctulata TaxID=72032 RepID=A0A0F4ZFZ1_9PEZI|nr:hypothetical protein TD95_002833 [Thielaviopsis punctulata]